MEYINKVKLYGVVSSCPEFSHQYTSNNSEEPYYHVDIKCSENPELRRKSAIIRCYFSGKELSKSNLKIGDKVTLSGEIINSRLRGLIDISVLVNSYEVVDELPSYEEEEVEFTGKVTKIFTTPDNYSDFINFVVTEYDENGIRTISTRVIIWNHLADYVMKNVEIGDNVIIKGYIANSKNKSRDDGEVTTVLVSEVHGTYFLKCDKE